MRCRARKDSAETAMRRRRTDIGKGNKYCPWRQLPLRQLKFRTFSKELIMSTNCQATAERTLKPQECYRCGGKPQPRVVPFKEKECIFCRKEQSTYHPKLQKENRTENKAAEKQNAAKGREQTTTHSNHNNRPQNHTLFTPYIRWDYPGRSLF